MNMTSATKISKRLRRKQLAGTSLMALSLAAGAVYVTPAEAATPITSTTTITSGTSQGLEWTGGNLSLIGTGTIVSGGEVGVHADNVGSIRTLNNAGLIASTGNTGVVIDGLLGTILNTGSISGDHNGINVDRYSSVGSISNAGLIQSTSSSAAIHSSGSIGQISNSGTIKGYEGYTGDDRSTLGSFINETTGTISAFNDGIRIQGPVDLIDNQGLIKVSGSSSGHGIYNRGGDVGTILNSGTIQSDGLGIYNFQFTSGSGGSAVTHNGTIGTINNTGRISTNSTAILNSNSGQTIGTIINNGLIESTDENAITNTGEIFLIENQTLGTLSGDHSAIVNGGASTIGTILNSGLIGSDGDSAIVNHGLITLIENQTIGTLSGNSDVVSVDESGEITSIVNKGLIESSAAYGVYNLGTIDSVTNEGTIYGAGAISNAQYSYTVASSIVIGYGHIGTISNSGLLEGNHFAAIANSGTIDLIENLAGGTITSSSVAAILSQDGSIGTINNAGLITASTAIAITGGTVGAITNSGTIAGNIVNDTVNDLTINGGAGTLMGTLTGQGTLAGLIDNQSSDLFFSAGQLFLNDNINVGTHTARFNGGLVLVNNNLSITGNVAQTGGVLLFGAASTTTYGSFDISGNAAFTSGQLAVGEIAGTIFATGQSYTIAQVEGSIAVGSSITSTIHGFASTLSTEDNGAGYDLILTIGATEDYVAPVYAQTGAAAGGAAAGTGAALVEIAGNSDPAATQFQTDVLLPLSFLSPADQQTALTQLSPTQLAPQLGLNSANPVAGVVTQHQDGGVASLSGSGMAAGSSAATGMLWGKIIGSTAKRDSSFGASGYDADAYGLVVGADAAVVEDFTAGLALSWLGASSDGKDRLNGSDVDLDTYQLTAYGTWRPATNFTVDGQISYGLSRYDQKRYIAFLGATAAADYDGSMLLGDIRVGYDVPLNANTTLTPYADLRAVRVEADGYTETGAGIANLTVNDMTTDDIRHEIGLKLGSSFDTSMGKYSPSVKLGWLHDYDDSALAIGATMGGVAFTSATERPAGDGVAAGVVLELATSDSVSIGLEYEGEFRSDYQNNTGVIKAAIKF